ncbi:NAD(P)H-dependent flavin oxidoreductase [Caldalkalibacillus salinus]|uniref:NAD(P)H-dependent flavin oxidoreductase n=1 Tax=Caldalkalibacillus salinus TaxID=2803787 RepID=UPI0019248A4C|nr:DUF561 domain-containing protein [Caldalkalibacillus salinus]
MRNLLCKQLDIQYPIIQGGMGNISPVSLCIAVSQAGGLGQIGVGTSSLEVVEDKLSKVKEAVSERPFGVNIPISVHPDVSGVIELVKQYNAPVVSLSAGNPKPWIPSLKEQGVKVLVVVSTVSQARKAAQAGADIIVAEGFEAAGKNSPKELTTMTLIPQVVSAVEVPVIAAGGIGDGKGLLAALSLGASGVQLGTRLVATQEAQVHQAYQQAMVKANDEDTLVLGRSYGFVTRVLNVPYTSALYQQERTGLSKEEWLEYLNEDRHHRGAILGHLDQGHVNAGQIVGEIHDVPTVAELFERMMREAKQQHHQLHAFLNKEEE